ESNDAAAAPAAQPRRPRDQHSRARGARDLPARLPRRPPPGAGRQDRAGPGARRPLLRRLPLAARRRCAPATAARRGRGALVTESNTDLLSPTMTRGAAQTFKDAVAARRMLVVDWLRDHPGQTRNEIVRESDIYCAIGRWDSAKAS